MGLSEQLPRILPTLPSLRSLHLTLLYHAILSPNFFPVLSTTSLSHFHLNLWPFPILFSSLPATIELLSFRIDDERGILEETVLKRLEEAGGWKVNHLPALRAIGICLGAEAVGWRRAPLRLEALVGEVEGFEVVLDDEVWRKMVPSQWQIK